MLAVSPAAHQQQRDHRRQSPSLLQHHVVHGLDTRAEHPESFGAIQQRDPQPVVRRPARRLGGLDACQGYFHIPEGPPGQGGVDPELPRNLPAAGPALGVVSLQRPQHLLLPVGQVDHRVMQAGELPMLADQARQLVERAGLGGVEQPAQHPLAVVEGRHDPIPSCDVRAPPPLSDSRPAIHPCKGGPSGRPVTNGAPLARPTPRRWVK
jgi:hypothetical protein